MAFHYPPTSNFSHLMEHDEQLVRLGVLAERYYVDDPNTCLLKLRQFTELLAKMVAARVGEYPLPSENQYELLHRLYDRGILTREIYYLFGEVRRAGNTASHTLEGDHATALNILKVAWQLGLWFHRTFQDPSFESAPFDTPSSFNIEEALKNLRYRLRDGADIRKIREMERERFSLKTLEADIDRAQAGVEQLLIEQQNMSAASPASALADYYTNANAASTRLQLDEAETRQLIDQQLSQAGWQADSVQLRYSNGTRPEKGKNLAIAEWPTASGPADYVLFVGLTPVAAVEAKRKNLDVSGALQQAMRYSRDFSLTSEMAPPGGAWGEFHLPFVFSANGRPYLRQLETRSGIWFRDVRRPDNLGHALDGWYTPEGLTALLKRDEDQAHQQLAQETFDYGFTLRPYQKEAIQSIEAAIAAGQREMLIAMATGTGKTKTCIALIYRLLKVQRFRRVLFLVDRSALGEQAANAFKDTRMENIQTFADIFGIKELDEQVPDTATAVHIATVQGMVKRILYSPEDAVPPAVDQYDCIVVDECHRGYLLDRELAEAELTFRSYEDYISKYRRVIDYFDAIKIGLTATPALHTTEIFGMPVYTYSYREAVIDGYLIDHEPPVQIITKLSEQGIAWKTGEEVKVYHPRRNQIELFKAPDEIKMEVDDFNRRVITEAFNQVVCEYLARELDPASKQKTLVYCVNDAHADMVVDLLKKAFVKQYGNIEDDAVVKITGAADKPLQWIRRYKNERLPNVAVTVDLLTTGIDVPEICNLVFMRRVNSRILFDQMLGRATRLCDEIGKEAFHIFDAVKLYEAIQDFTEMQPVVANPKISFTQLVEEMISVSGGEEQELIRDQFVAKLQRKKRRLSDRNQQDFEVVAGMSPDDFIGKLRAVPTDEIANWFLQFQSLGEILDRQEQSLRPMLVSEHPDQLQRVEHGYGQATKPQDYLDEFAAYIKTHHDEIPALVTVLTRPRDLTRKQLRELAMELDRAGFSEVSLTAAWRELTNQEIAAHIVGFIRHIATGDPLVPYEQRVDWALGQMLASHYWTNPQRQWLQKIAAQTKANIIVDQEALDDPDLLFRREGGGFIRLDRIFDGQLEDTLNTFNELLWKLPDT